MPKCRRTDHRPRRRQYSFVMIATTVTINGKKFPKVDCMSWAIAGATPSCRRGLDLSGCDTCELKVVKPKFKDKIESYIKAEASLAIHGPLDEEKYQSRLATCRSCNALEVAVEPKVGHCKECGCGKNPRSEISVKARMPLARCPRNLWTPPST